MNFTETQQNDIKGYCMRGDYVGLQDYLDACPEDPSAMPKSPQGFSEDQLNQLKTIAAQEFQSVFLDKLPKAPNPAKSAYATPKPEPPKTAPKAEAEPAHGKK